MDILILFTKERISSLKGDRTDFTNKISESAKIISIENNAEDIHIQIIEGFVPNASNTNKIIVLKIIKKLTLKFLLKIYLFTVTIKYKN